MGAAKPVLGQQRRLEGAVAGAVPGCQHLAGEVVQGVVSFWRESRTNHIGRLACLTGPRGSPVRLPPHRPHSTLWAQEFSMEQKGGGRALVSQNYFLGPLAPFYRWGNRGTKKSNCPRPGLGQNANFWMLRSQWVFSFYVTVIKSPSISPQFPSDPHLCS